jgi:hypothetical protein
VGLNHNAPQLALSIHYLIFYMKQQHCRIDIQAQHSFQMIQTLAESNYVQMYYSGALLCNGAASIWAITVCAPDKSTARFGVMA